MVIKLIIFAFFFIQISPYFCYSQCATSVNASCNGDPYACTAYYVPFLGTTNTLSSSLYSIVDISKVSALTAINNFKMSQTFTGFTCSVAYTSATLNVTYNYHLLGKFVSTDYIYKRYTITKPHYQIMIRLSVTFIGVWSSNDYLNLYTSDGTTSNNFPMRYSCTDSNINYTQILCNNTYYGNRVDCVIPYTFTFDHNSTYLLVNLSSLTRQKDPNNQFWSPLDINVVTVDCSSLCSACYTSNSPNNCTSCKLPNYLNGNTCSSTCPTYKLSNPNPLLGGFCVTSCPQGYYLSASTCMACASGCLTCTSSTGCLLTADSGAKYSLWMDKLALWIIIIAVGCLLIFGILWKIFCEKKSRMSEQQQRIISQVNETRHADEKMTTQQNPQPQNEKNIHIEQIDFNDHVMVDTNPRKRKRQEKDMNRSNININL